jgi:hypothetical protein
MVGLDGGQSVLQLIVAPPIILRPALALGSHDLQSRDFLLLNSMDFRFRVTHISFNGNM